MQQQPCFEHRSQPILNTWWAWKFCFISIISLFASSSTSIAALVLTRVKEQVCVQQPGFGQGSQPSKIEKPLSPKPLLINIIITERKSWFRMVMCTLPFNIMVSWILTEICDKMQCYGNIFWQLYTVHTIWQEYHRLKYHYMRTISSTKTLLCFLKN